MPAALLPLHPFLCVFPGPTRRPGVTWEAPPPPTRHCMAAHRRTPSPHPPRASATHRGWMAWPGALASIADYACPVGWSLAPFRSLPLSPTHPPPSPSPTRSRSAHCSPSPCSRVDVSPHGLSPAPPPASAPVLAAVPHSLVRDSNAETAGFEDSGAMDADSMDVLGLMDPG